MAPKKVSFEVDEWMKLAIIAAALLLFSAMLAANIPACHECSKGDVSFFQVWFALMSTASGIGGIITTIAAIIAFINGD